MEGKCIQNGQLRTSSCSTVFHQFWEQSVVNIDIAGFVFNKSSPRAKWRDQPHDDGADHSQKPNTKIEKRDGSRDADDRVRVFLNGWTSLPIIQRTQNCMHPHTFLRTQIRNVLRKWYQKSWKHSILKPTSQKTHWRSSTTSRKVW